MPFLHIANGTSTTTTIEAAGLPGRTSIWADPLHDGPVPDVPDEELMRIRAKVFADDSGDAGGVAAEVRRWRAAVDGVAADEQIVLWFEHDLFDQLNLIQLLDRLAASDAAARVSLICVGSFPGRPNFKGLGELTPQELAPLFDTRLPVTRAQYDLASRAWQAFRAPEPTAIAAFLASDTSALPFLAPALARHLEEFPSTSDGLSRTERRLLELAAGGPVWLGRIFPRMHDGETAFYIADVSFVHVAEELADCSPPLVTISGADGSDSLAGTIEITPAGREVLEGRVDRAALAGIDRWLGGVHLTGRTPRWRWDRDGRRLIDAAGSRT
jgi:hypothetical protein